jgi:hypothetical protein
MTRLLTTLALTGLAAALVSGGEPFVEWKAEGCPRFSVLEVKDAPRESFFAFLPCGLLADDAGQAQFAHVMEHMLIRSTEKSGLADGAIQFNGETGDITLRLDVDAPPKLAGDALRKLFGWLSTTEVDGDQLTAEKKNIALEIENTSRGGFTHKWALAAWNQVARLGQDHANVRGDVERATVDQVEAAIDEHVDLSKVRIVAAGPLSLKQIQELAEPLLAQANGLGALGGALSGLGAKRHEVDAAKRAQKGEPPLATGDRVAKWDLPNAHLLAWYVLPNGGAEDAAEAFVLANVLALQLQHDAKLAGRKIVALASADAAVPAGRLLMLSASLPSEADAKVALAAFDAALAALPASKSPTLDGYLSMFAAELSGLPDWKALRTRAGAGPAAEHVEAQVALTLALREIAAGHSIGELGAAFKKLTRARLEKTIAERLAAPKRATLLLTPGG